MSAGRIDVFVQIYGERFASRRNSDDYVPLVRVAPVYPARALRRRQSGYVDLIFTVDEKGMPTDVEITGGQPGIVFDKAVINAVTKFRYLPRHRDGEAVRVEGVRTTIRFDIQ